jgi:hypothetical protein
MNRIFTTLLSLLFLFGIASSVYSQEVILSFDDGFLGDQDGNGCINCTNTSTLGITNIRFGQVSNTGQFTAQGNDIVGFVRFKDANGDTYQINGNIQYRITTTGTLRAFGFVPTNTTPVTIITNTTTSTPSGTFDIRGISDPNSSTFGFIVEGQSIILNNGSIRGNAATSSLVDELNFYLGNQADFSIDDVTVNESDGTATLTVTLSQIPSEQKTVDYSTLNSTAQAGSDYTSDSGTLTFPANSSTTQTVTITIVDDTIVEADEVFIVQLSNPTGGSGITDNEGTVTILDNDTQQSENLILTLTNRSCWRFLSSPFQNLTYNNIIGPLWTQGATGSDDPPPATDESVSNIFIWNKSTTNNDVSGWTTAGLDLDSTIPPGEGFLMSIFEDDNADGTIDASEEFDKTLTITGTAHPFDATISPTLNSNPNGWTLVGNPFNDAIDFGYLVANGLTTELTDVAYVYNINGSSSDPANETNNNPGGWVSTDGSIGDLHDGKIAVFQGFFIQNTSSATSPGITFNNASRTTGATFYGKKKNNKDFIRLELSGMGTSNSTWLTFSDYGSKDKVSGDAFELMPYHDQYTLFGSKKDDEVLDIGQYPVETGLEIPLHVEASAQGTYTISATDINLAQDIRVVLVDHERDQRITIKQGELYQFDIDKITNEKSKSRAFRCGLNGVESIQKFGPQKAKSNGQGVHRFSVVIQKIYESPTEKPNQIELYQNYPNPFNPTTQISYQLPEQADVRLQVFDMAGRQVATLVNENVSAGTHSVNFNATNLSSGVYMYRLQAGSVVLTRKLTLVK